MILKGAQRGSGKALALHLLNEQDNDFVEVHLLEGFVSDDVLGAFKEVEAISKGTRCKQPFFSVSLSPPPDASVAIETFETAAQRIAEAHDLKNQPRALIFHEKDGRRHAHLVISRIDAATMTAKNLPHFKNWLQAISRDLFVEFGWRMPKGLLDPSQKNPTNVTLAEWQSAKRRGRNAIDQKALIAQCYAASDDRRSFAAALEERGYRLAQGDRRGHVVVAHDGEVIAVPRAVGRKAKEVRARLGEPEELPSVSEALALHRADVRAQFGRLGREARQGLTADQIRLDRRRAAMIARHRSERETLDNGQAARWADESQARRLKLKRGLAGLWQRISGQRAQVQERNEREAYEALQRDRIQRQAVIDSQLSERRDLEAERSRLRKEAIGLVQELKAERNELVGRLRAPKPVEATRRRKARQSVERDHGIDLEP